MRYIAIPILTLIYIIWGYYAIKSYRKQIKEQNNYSILDLTFRNYMWFVIILSVIISYTKIYW